MSANDKYINVETVKDICLSVISNYDLYDREQAFCIAAINQVADLVGKAVAKGDEKMINPKAAYLTVIKSVKRDGFDDFTNWLHNETDFFTAPASTRYHGAEESGLLKHSLSVYFHLLSLASNEYDYDTIAIVALYHDICKTNFYKAGTRNVKNEETGKWEKVPTYFVDEQFPYGSHGGKSVYLLLTNGVKLTDEEATAINCHMGGWDVTSYHNPSGAYEKYPLALYLHIADMLATYKDGN